jgi:hypothetical protein
VDGGELRFIYGAVEPATIVPLALTVIFEYRVTLRPDETARDWAAAWHELGALPFGPELNARLDTVVAQGLARATLVRVLTNEEAFGAPASLPWEMRQFVPAQTDAGVIRLVEVAVSDTPRLTLASTPELAAWIDENAATILAGLNPLPPQYIAASAPIPTPGFTWQTAARDPAVAAAFNSNTCNGCHGGRSPDDLPFHHIGPPASGYRPGAGPAQLSRFLHNPGHADELGRRERTMGEVLCTRCGESGY